LTRQDDRPNFPPAQQIDVERRVRGFWSPPHSAIGVPGVPYPRRIEVVAVGDPDPVVEPVLDDLRAHPMVDRGKLDCGRQPNNLARSPKGRSLAPATPAEIPSDRGWYDARWEIGFDEL
jgi:hypothetical protein